MAIFDSKSGKCVKHIENAHFSWIRAIVFVINFFMSLSILTNIIHLYNYDNAINYEIGWNDNLIISFFPLNII